ncbi:MAG: M20/M25/M40 family metallo-hydrolase, partial [Gemmatimonadetes bacterium]|nr:M20/M25/M40 family metallo-hydrolase [Gemmatimonadota bacterium]
MSDAAAFRSESPPTQWTAIRREFHRRAELSGHESGTAEAVAEHLTRFGARPIVRGLGGHGVAARFDSGRDGARVLLRAELDALPIAESRSLPHHSAQATVSHKCGHDGHLTTLLAVAERLAATPPRAGAVTVLFQPAEETGEGAARVRSDPRWEELAADVAIAWHNLPGQALGQVILRDDVFAYGSRGLLAEFEGESAHAFEPERAVSPLPAIRRALRLLPGHTET